MASDEGKGHIFYVNNRPIIPHSTSQQRREVNKMGRQLRGNAGEESSGNSNLCGHQTGSGQENKSDRNIEAGEFFVNHGIMKRNR